MRLNQLNAREKTIMDLLWTSDSGLTSIEMLDRLDDTDWNKLSIFRTINSLIDKNLIEVSGFEQYNTQYARRFRCSITREEYAARLLKMDGLTYKSLGNIAMAMIKNDGDDNEETREELIESLQEIIDSLKKNQKIDQER
ncbi:BlaI/MecI/CopY family transcriptional regulator [Butyrivibrio sp. MC2021]|uniref:BlaI/MecI/CopY family transcriptional regulator n=1 Tax=Butyrivibrio sp. MC2021 TaxID=1408306 RepID=UPI00047A6C6C|nr:BlaI/MecI/CopY family transcriptional regulator [Butyrivibrio sp. MC2021]